MIEYKTNTNAKVMFKGQYCANINGNYQII